MRCCVFIEMSAYTYSHQSVSFLARSVCRVAGIWTVSSVLAAGVCAAQQFEWTGDIGNGYVTHSKNWLSEIRPDLINGAAENDIWLFRSVGKSLTIDVNENNVRLAGLDFRSGSAAYTFTNRAIDIYGFSVDGTTYGIRNNSGKTQTFSVEDIDLFSSQTWSAQSGSVILDYGTELKLNNYNLTLESGSGYGFTFRDQVNGNGRIDIVGGDNLFEKNVNSTGFNFSGQSNTVFNSAVAANNATNTVSGKSTVEFQNTFNSYKLVVEGDSLVIFSGNVEKVLNNGGIDLRCGTLLLQNNNLVGQGTNFQFSGGTLDTNGYSDLSMGSLTLSASSTIDLGDGNSRIRFNQSSGLAWSSNSYLEVENWSGSVNGNGADQLIFGVNSGGLNSSQISQITFLNPEGFAEGWYSAQQLATGEIVPYQILTDYIPRTNRCGDVVPVPEPRTYALFALFGLIGIVEYRRRRINRAGT